MKMTRIKKNLNRCLSVCLSVFLLMSIMPSIALAQSEDTQTDSYREVFSSDLKEKLGSIYEQINEQDSKLRQSDFLERRVGNGEFSLFVEGNGGSGGGTFPAIELEGEGTEESPYLLSNEDDLYALGAFGENTYFKLTQDIELEEDWVPINAFEGVFDGDGKTISGLTVTEDEHSWHTGLFRHIYHNAVVKNLTLSDVNVSGDMYVGALAGLVSGSVENCSVVSGSVTGYHTVGGLAGMADGSSISNCSSSADVKGSRYIGGLVGEIFASTITSSNASGSVTSKKAESGNGNYGYAGGLAGQMIYTNAENCFATGDVTYGEEDDNYAVDFIGGFAGAIISYNYDVKSIEPHGFMEKQDFYITNCEARGNVSIKGSYIGGFAGAIINYDTKDLITMNIDNCKSYGNINAGGPRYYSYKIGGFAGELRDVTSITNCKALGEQISVGFFENEGIGGFAGFAYTDKKDTIIENCTSTYNIEANYVEYVGGFIGYAISYMNYIENEIIFNSSSNIINCTSSGDIYIGKDEEMAHGYNIYIGGFIGLSGNICVEESYSMGNISVNNSLESGVVGGFVGASAISSFIKSYAKGNISSSGFAYYMGGFAGNDYLSSFTNCYAEGDVTAEMHGRFIGGFLGGNNRWVMSPSADEDENEDEPEIFLTSIESCYSTGNVTVCVAKMDHLYTRGSTLDIYAIGGFIGGLSEDANITDCLSLGAVTLKAAAGNNDYYGNQNHVGGFIGSITYADITIDSCNSESNVTLKMFAEDVGGFAGFAYGEGIIIENCFSTGDVTAEKSGNNIGGFLGGSHGYDLAYSSEGPKIPVVIENCYSTGDVTVNTDDFGHELEGGDFDINAVRASTTAIGGFIGYLSYMPYTVSNCFSKGDVTITNTKNIDYAQAYGVGGFIGILRNTVSTISFCYSEGKVSSEVPAICLGGFAGIIDSDNSTIENCFNTGCVESDGMYIGGFAGKIAETNVINCYSDSNISGDAINMGGFVAITYDSNYTNCHAYTSINSTGEAGGFAAYAEASSFEQCSSTGDITTDLTLDDEVLYYLANGGFIGYAYESSINNCYSNVDISSTITGEGDNIELSVGGFIGKGFSTNISNSYSAGKISVSNEIDLTSVEIAPFANFIDELGTLENCFYDAEVAEGYADSSFEIENITGLSTNKMKDKKTFTDAGWDFDDVWDLNQSYPHFIKMAVKGVVKSKVGNTVEGAPVVIGNITTTSTNEYGEFTAFVNKGYYKLSIPFTNSYSQLVYADNDLGVSDITVDMNFISGSISGISSGDIVEINLLRDNLIIETKIITATKNNIRYYFNDVSNGSYSVEISCIGYLERKIDVNINNGDSVRNNTTLSKITAPRTGGGGGGYRQLDSNYAIVNNTIVPVRKFVDISEFSWANDAISILAQKGVINGTSEETYSPGNSITRADFIILLVRSLGLQGISSNNFSDVDKDSYYFDAVGIAKQLGIAMGSGEGTFNPTGEISRQDMMVLTVRALRAAGVLLDTSDNSDALNKFNDSGSISDYAIKDVIALLESGLILGSDSSLFPKNNLTRAEAAVLIHRLMQKANRL